MIVNNFFSFFFQDSVALLQTFQNFILFVTTKIRYKIFPIFSSATLRSISLGTTTFIQKPRTHIRRLAHVQGVRCLESCFIDL